MSINTPGAFTARAAVSASRFAAAASAVPSKAIFPRPSVKTTTNGVRSFDRTSAATSPAIANPAASGVPPPPGSSASARRARVSDRVGGRIISAPVPRKAINATCARFT